MRGNDTVLFTDLVRDTIQTHGLAWAVRYYAKRLQPFELRFFMKLAYC
jgi:hypothetical protein